MYVCTFSSNWIVYYFLLLLLKCVLIQIKSSATAVLLVLPLTALFHHCSNQYSLQLVALLYQTQTSFNATGSLQANMWPKHHDSLGQRHSVSWLSKLHYNCCDNILWSQRWDTLKRISLHLVKLPALNQEWSLASIANWSKTLAYRCPESIVKSKRFLT